MIKINEANKNEEAQFKLLAFNGVLENQALHEQNDDIEATFIFDSSSKFYQQELRKDQFKHARQMDPSNQKRKNPWELSSEGFKNKRVREEKYFKKHVIYLENKKKPGTHLDVSYLRAVFSSLQDQAR